MKASDIRDSDVNQLTQKLLDLKKEAFNLRFLRVSGQLNNPSRIKVVRRSIARVLTILNEKKLGE